ncbi:transposase [Nonomuraea jabiensis]|uniref:transposase n=1 Tax=Nonomuraea jabiensis TaxID=882448 RepID=UPI0036AC72FF
MPAGIRLRELVRLAKIRWRIEHDYRELKTGLGLTHFEGRSWTGWHRHVTLVSAAHLFLTELRLPAQIGWPGLTFYKILHMLQVLLATWSGRCPTCHQRPP